MAETHNNTISLLILDKIDFKLKTTKTKEQLQDILKAENLYFPANQIKEKVFYIMHNQFEGVLEGEEEWKPNGARIKIIITDDTDKN